LQMGSIVALFECFPEGGSFLWAKGVPLHARTPDEEVQL
jgi:hypothetical protein